MAPALLAATLLSIGVSWAVWTGGSPPGYPELYLYILPERLAASRPLVEGFLPLWNPLIYCGTPHAAYATPGVFYPPHWFFPSTGRGMLAFGVLHGIWAGSGFYLWQRRSGTGRLPSFVSALAYGGCGQMVFNWACPKIGASLSWMPWAFAAADGIRISPSIRSASVLTAVVSLQFLAGYPQTVLWTAVGVGAWMMWKGAGRRTWAAMAGAALGVLGLTALQWVPFLERVLSDSREYWKMDYASFDPGDYLTALVPGVRWCFGLPKVDKAYYTSHFNLYAGLVPLGLAAYALAARRRGDQAFWALFALGAALWAFGTGWAGGSAGPLRAWIEKSDPCKAAFLVPFGLCASAAGVLDRWPRHGAWGRRSLWVLAAVMCMDTAATPWRMLMPSPDPTRTEAWKSRAETMRGCLGAGRLCFDTRMMGAPQRQVGIIKEEAHGLAVDTNILSGVSSVVGRGTFTTQTAKALEWFFYGSYPGAGCAPEVSSCLMAVTPLRLEDERWRLQGEWDGYRWYRNAQFLPQTRLVDYVREFPSREAVLGQLTQKEKEVRKVLWVERPPGGSLVALPKPCRVLGVAVGAPPPPPRKAIATKRSGPNRMTAVWESPAGGFLVWSESCEPGWRAWLDGKPTRILRAYGLFQAVHVPKEGAHRVDFRYEPATFRLGLFVSLVFLGTLLPAGRLLVPSVRRMRT